MCKSTEILTIQITNLQVMFDSKFYIFLLKKNKVEHLPQLCIPQERATSVGTSLRRQINFTRPCPPGPIRSIGTSCAQGRVGLLGQVVT